MPFLFLWSNKYFKSKKVFLIYDAGRNAMKRVKIGVIPLVDYERESYWMLPGYMEALTEAGGLPLILPLTDDKKIIEQIADECDAFLFTGGHDVSPELYGENISDDCGECCIMRDKMESMLINKVLKTDKSILGICRGIQLLNVVLGGTLYQDLPSQKPSEINHKQMPPYDIPIHKVNIIENTILHNIIEKDELWVNSYHHQAVKDLSPLLNAIAYSPDGLVEAATMKSKKFVLAIQWHPEFSYKKDESSRKIFKAFVESAKNKI